MATEPKSKSKTYKIVRVGGKERRYSHYIWHQHTGHWPVWPEVIHHRDGNPLNDDFSNLQLMTHAEHTSLHFSGENSPNWLGDAAHIATKYNRHRRNPELYPPLTEEERQEFNAYHKERRRKKASGEKKQTLKANSYKHVWVNGILKKRSHKVWFENTGHWPDYDEIIHHIDGNKLNDSFDNLQLMTRAEHNSLFSGKNHYKWLGDNASVEAKYQRHHKEPDKYPPLTEEERKELRAYRKEYHRKWREKRNKQKLSSTPTEELI